MAILMEVLMAMGILMVKARPDPLQNLTWEQRQQGWLDRYRPEDDMTGLSQEMGNRDLMGWGSTPPGGDPNALQYRFFGDGTGDYGGDYSGDYGGGGGSYQAPGMFGRRRANL